VPVRLTVCGLPLALSAISRTAALVPRAVGRKRTLMVQREPAAKVAPQVVVREKSPLFVPVIEMPVMFRTKLPVFLTVTDLAELVVPTRWYPNEMDVVERLTTGAAGARPVPARPTVCGLPAALSVTETLAVRVPAAVGVKVTEIVQFAPAVRLAGHALVCA